MNPELCHRGREIDAELDVLPLDEELVSDDFDQSRLADHGMRCRHRIPVEMTGLLTDGRGTASQFSAAGTP